MDEQQKPAEAQPAAQHEAHKAPQNDAQANKWYGVLAYLSILCLIPLFAAKTSPFAQFHAKQGLVLLLADIVLRVIDMVLPFDMVGLVTMLAGIAIFILAIIGIVNAWQGKMWSMPVVGDIAKKIKF